MKIKLLEELFIHIKNFKTGKMLHDMNFGILVKYKMYKNMYIVRPMFTTYSSTQS